MRIAYFREIYQLVDHFVEVRMCRILVVSIIIIIRDELSYLAPLGSENISAPYFKQCFFQGGEVLPPRQSNTTPPSPKTEITNILFYILNFASIITFKM